MNAFHFPLQKALQLRQTQLELAEARYKQQVAAVGELDRLRAETEASGARAEIEVRQWSPVAGHDLAALERFRLRVKSEEVRIAEQRAEAAREVATRQEAMLQARRRCKLLERLRERRLAEWQAGRDRELEELANDSFLAQWNRRASE
jgi:flagellar export protein FliJ